MSSPMRHDFALSNLTARCAEPFDLASGSVRPEAVSAPLTGNALHHPLKSTLLGFDRGVIGRISEKFQKLGATR
jgi:hypothetical protein